MNSGQRSAFTAFLTAVSVLVGIGTVLFLQSFEPTKTLFNNDGPLGAISAASGSMTTAFKGVWQDLNWLGVETPAALPHTSALLWFVLGNDPVTFSKFHVPIALIALGASLWILLRCFGFRHSVCGLAAIAAMLNMNTFSHSCWGLPSRSWTLASTFLALAALRSGVDRRPLLTALLAGLAVANGIMEGFDVGAIFSIYVAAFAVFVVFAHSSATFGSKLVDAVRRVGIVAVFSAVCAAAALSTLIGTQIQGVAGMEQSAESKERRWDGATMWSLPKLETARVMVPGLFGYRMDTENGGNYWGSVGQQPGVEQSRHSGAGEYAGALVLVVAAFGLASAFRKKDNPYTLFERRTVFFFSIIALGSVLLAWGRHAPFYRIIYELPYFSTIRNPIKFMHPFHMALLVLFGFGLEALFRTYVKDTASKLGGVKETLSVWWKSAPEFEKRWTFGSVTGFCLLAFAALIYASSSTELSQHLAKAGFTQTISQQIVQFSQIEVGYALVFIGTAVFALIVILSGWFSGRRRLWLVLLLGLFLSLDLMRANSPWIVYYNYKDRYATNPIIELLRDKPYLQRVTARIAPFSTRHFVTEQTGFFEGVVNTWLQHHFQYYNIQSLEVVQMPRPPEIDQQFFTALIPGGDRPNSVLTRMWELSNTRYLIGDKQAILSSAQQLDPGQDRFKVVQSFDMVPKPGVLVDRLTIDDLDWVLKPDGRFALVEFTAALPRAKLYSNWQQSTNAAATLKQLTAPDFNPHERVIVQADMPFAPTVGTNISGTVTFTRYTPKQITLAVSNSVPSLLLYNDKIAANWQATVDGKPEVMVRANFMMRGIPLPAGSHVVEMIYTAPTQGIYLSGTGILLGLLVLIVICFVDWPKKTSVAKAD